MKDFVPDLSLPFRKRYSNGEHDPDSSYLVYSNTVHQFDITFETTPTQDSAGNTEI